MKESQRTIYVRDIDHGIKGIPQRGRNTKTVKDSRNGHRTANRASYCKVVSDKRTDALNSDNLSRAIERQNRTLTRHELRKAKRRNKA